MTHTNHNLDDRRSVLASLRALIPDRQLRFSEAFRVAEWQATRLLDLIRIDDVPVPSECVTELPRIRVVYRDIPTSGLSYWDGQVWVICLNRTEPVTRQKFTLFHEYKHIVDHGRTEQLYGNTRDRSAENRAEQAADYFAGCVLIPRRFLKRAWGQGVQRPTALAQMFQVSPRAVSVRLAQTGLTDPMPRCDTASHVSTFPQPGRYHRNRSIDTSLEAVPRKTPEVVNV